MFMGNQDAGELFRRASNRRESLADLAEAEPGINQDAGLVGFQVGAVAGGTAAKNRQAYGHALTLPVAEIPGKNRTATAREN